MVLVVSHFSFVGVVLVLVVPVPGHCLPFTDGNGINNYLSYHPTDANDFCSLIGNSPKDSTAWFNASKVIRICSSVRSTGSRDKISLASLLRPTY